METTSMPVIGMNGVEVRSLVLDGCAVFVGKPVEMWVTMGTGVVPVGMLHAPKSNRRNNARIKSLREGIFIVVLLIVFLIVF
jgi:hypothetical protein